MKRMLSVVLGVALVGILSVPALSGAGPEPPAPMIASKRFVWQQPLPQGNPIKAVDFVTDTLGWAVGDGGTVLKTTDGGFTWMNQGPVGEIGGSDKKTGVYDVHFVDANNGWIAADTMVYRTTNGGATWSNSGAWYTLPDSAQYLAYTAVDFADANNGWWIGSGQMFHTTNGGNTVATQTPPPGLTVSVVDAASSTEAFAYAYTSTGFLATTDGGSTWEQRTFTGTAHESQGPYSMAVCSASTIYAEVGFDLLKSTNGGSTWTTQTVTTLDPGDDPYLVYAVDGDTTGSRVYVRTDGGDLHASSDGGVTWSKKQERSSILTLDAPSAATLFAVRHDRVEGSADGGSTWYGTPTPGPGASYQAIDFTSETTGSALSDQGYARTSDGGLNWDVRGFATLGINLSPNVMTFLESDPSVGWISGTPPYGQPSVYKTADAGESWTSLEETTMVGITEMAFPDADNGWALYTYQDGFWHTTDGGNTWALVPHAGSHWDLDFVDANHGWVAFTPMTGLELTLARTTDGGSTWITETVAPSSGGILRYIDFVDTQNGYAIDSFANLFKTADGGLTWEQKAFWPYAADFEINDMKFSTPEDGWVVGEQQTSALIPTKRHDFAAHTTDGGETWDFYADALSSDKGWTGTNVNINALDTFGPYMWFVGSYGSIVKSRLRPVVELATTSKTLSAYNQSTALTGVLTNDGPAGGQRVDVWTCSSAGGTYVKSASGATTAGDGSFSITVRPSSATYYKVKAAGDATTQASAPSGYVKITPKPYVGNPVAPSRMTRSVYYTTYGYLKPRHTAGTYPVRIYLYRYVSGSWRSYGYVKAKAANYSSYTKYSARVRLTGSGRWRLRAYHPTDSGQTAAWSSGYDYVTVP